MFLHRFKYYVTWGMADIVYNVSGMGYEGTDKDGRHDWSGMVNVDIWKLEVSRVPLLMKLKLAHQMSWKSQVSVV